MNREIITIGGNHHNTLSILRSLGEKGIKSLLIILSEDPKPYVSYSKYIKDFRVIKKIEEIRTALYELHKSKEKAIIIACADTIASYIDINRDSLSKDFILPGSLEQGRITQLMNKNTMMQLAIDSGLSVPKSWIVYLNNIDNIDNIEYPCIVKPLVSKNGSKADIVICNTEDELKKYLKHCNCQELQVQEYIKKNIEFQLIGCSLDSGKTILIPGASIILRQPKNTNTGFLRYIPITKFSYDINSCLEFIKNTKYSGLFSLEFIRDNNGVDYFMEINFRNDGNSICVTASGINLPYIWYRYNCGDSIENEICYDSMKEVLVMPEFNDIGNAIHKRISWAQWLMDVKRTDRFMEFSKYDQKPFWMYIFKRIFNK